MFGVGGSNSYLILVTVWPTLCAETRPETHENKVCQPGWVPGCQPAGSLQPMIAEFGSSTADHPTVCTGEILFGYRRSRSWHPPISSFAPQRIVRCPDFGVWGIYVWSDLSVAPVQSLAPHLGGPCVNEVFWSEPQHLPAERQRCSPGLQIDGGAVDKAM